MLKRIPIVLSLLAIAYLLWMHLMTSTDYLYYIDRNATAETVRQKIIEADKGFTTLLVAALIITIVVGVIELVDYILKKKKEKK